MRDVKFKITEKQAALVLETLDAWVADGRSLRAQKDHFADPSDPRRAFVAFVTLDAAEQRIYGITISDALCQAVPTMRMILDEEKESNENS